jgi:hypothetical protein
MDAENARAAPILSPDSSTKCRCRRFLIWTRILKRFRPRNALKRLAVDLFTKAKPRTWSVELDVFGGVLIH